MCKFNNALLALVFALVSFFAASCAKSEKLDASCYTPAGCSQVADSGTDDTGTPTDSDTQDTDTDTAPTDSGDTADSGDSGDSGDTGTADTGYSFEENQVCWDSVPFDIQFMTLNRSKATLVATDWDSGLDWVDYDPIYIVDGSAGTNQVTVYSPYSCGDSSMVEGQIDLPVGFEMRDENDPMYNNGIVTSFQADGTVAEISYLAPCNDGSGSYEGWILPDGGDLQDACALGYSDTDWLGAHGGSHTTATQAIRPGELTGTAPIGRPLPIEIDHTHMKCPTGATSGFDCFVGPLAASGDASALSDYSGSIDGLTMGSFLVLPSTYDCTAMNTTPAERLCEVLRDQFMFIVDDSYGQDEVAFPMEDSVPDEVEAEWGIQLHNATGCFADDVAILMASVQVITNIEDAGVLYSVE